MKVKTILLFAILIMLCSCKSQNKSKNLKSPEKAITLGKPVSEIPKSIWKIYQDKNDNYWFGSNGDGVFYYNGNTVKQFTIADGLVDNQIRDIQSDTFGNVYIGTPKGISKFNGKTFTTLNLIKSSSNQWQLKTTDLWFNCNGNANHVYRYDGESLFELALPKQDLKAAFGNDVKGLSFKGMNSSPYSVFGIDKDKAGNIWFGTVVAGAFRYDGNSFLWIAEKELSTLPDGRVPGIRSMIEDKNGYFWLSNFISKYKINDNDSVVNYEKLKAIDTSKGLLQDRLPYFNSGLSDKKGNLWMTTYGGGTWKYDGEKLLNFPVKDNEAEALLISIYQDNKGVLWLGTDNAGVYKFNGETFEKFEF